MTKILFVCHGNICRSPMAEYIFMDMVRKAGVEDEFIAASAAVSSEETGNDVYPPARRELQKHGIPCPRRRAVKMTAADYDAYDCLVCMDSSNLRLMERITGRSGGKQRLLLSFSGEDRDVFDPWYTGDFAAAYDDIEKGCAALFHYLSADRQ